jgi:flagellar biosynthesis GTPase FlhF
MIGRAKEMGKKHPNKKLQREREEEEEEGIDPELEEEIAALKSIQEERQKENQPEKEDEKKMKPIYNKEGILKYLQEEKEESLPFIQTLEVCGGSIDVPDVNDDLQREVRNIYICILAMINILFFFF